FSAALESTPKASIVLESDGGAIDDGLAIGRQVFKSHLPTIVRKTCASACALIWLAGNPRYAFDKATIGFHTAHDLLTKIRSKEANALVNAYLDELGMPNITFQYVTSAQPLSMEWLDSAKAKQFGIDFIWKKS